MPNAMDKLVLEDKLRDKCPYIPWQGDDGIIYAPDQPVLLENMLWRLIDEDKRAWLWQNAAGTYDYLCNNLVAEIGGRPWLLFEWGGARIGWTNEVLLLPLESRREAVLFHVAGETPGFAVIALLEGRNPRALLPALFSCLLDHNGAALNIEAYGGLPTRMVNRIPHSIPMPFLKDWLRNWMEWAESEFFASWRSLAEELLAVDNKKKQDAGQKEIRRALQAKLARETREYLGAEYSDSFKAELLDWYLTRCYVEKRWAGARTIRRQKA